jgi:hypothetical protein
MRIDQKSQLSEWVLNVKGSNHKPSDSEFGSIFQEQYHLERWVIGTKELESSLYRVDARVSA